LIRRRHQHFNANISPFRWALRTEYQRAIQRNIVGESAFCVQAPLIPVKDYWQSKFVSNRGSSLHSNLATEEDKHSGIQLKRLRCAPQVTDCLKIEGVIRSSREAFVSVEAAD
jgi:hypothetical protein